MATHHTIPVLRPLFEYLDHLTERATVEGLTAVMTDLDVRLEDVAEHVRFNEKRYLRNLFRKGTWYHALVLCWRSGQRSPIHNHAQSTCGLHVLSGVATETRFEATPSGLLKAVNSVDMACGDLVVSQDADVHQISNLQEAGQDLVTLHIYSPPMLRMDTYSLTEPTIGEYRPEILEHMGSGI